MIFFCRLGCRVFRRTQLLEHPLQGTGFADIARKDPAAPGKATAIQYQHQRDQGAIVAFLFAMTEGHVVIVSAGALEKGIGQIEQSNGFLDIEQRTVLTIQLLLDGIVMRPE